MTYVKGLLQKFNCCVSLPPESGPWNIGSLDEMGLLVEDLIIAMRAIENGNEHFYKWSGNWYTTNKDHVVHMYPDRLQLYLNGEHITGPIRRCVTGKNGFIVLMRYEDGDRKTPMQNGDGPAEETVYGHVEVKVGELP